MMKEQNFSNHLRIYPTHHLVFYPVVGALFTASAAHAYLYPANRLEWVAISALFILIAWLSYILRQHYALTNQNRIVRLEMRLRYYQLTGKRFEPLEKVFTFDQIAALRFASDEELPALIDRTQLEQLRPVDIKRSVKNWQPDQMRV
jgi:hypothetical protein